MAKKAKAMGEGAAQALAAGTAVQLASGAPVKLVQPAPEPKGHSVITNIRITRSQLYAVQDEAVRRARVEGGRPDHSQCYREAMELWLLAREARRAGKGIEADQVATVLERDSGA